MGESAGGNTRADVLLLIADKLPELVKTQVEAIKGIKIDKVTVWEGGGGQNGDGNSTANFISGMYRAVPPLNDLLNMAGMELPEFIAVKKTETTDGEEKK